MAEAVQAEQENQRSLAGEKRQSLSNLQKEGVDKIKKLAVKATKQAVLRIINVAFAATLVGIFVTYIIMSVQLFAGNLMGVKAIKLEAWEIVIWVFLTLFLLAFLILVFILLAITSDPWGLAWELVKNYVSSLWSWATGG